MIWDHDHIDNDKLIDLIHRARRNGHNSRLAVDTIVAHLTMQNTDLGWEDAAEVAGTDAEYLISKKRSLVKDNVIRQEIPYPSTITKGESSDLLEFIERKNPGIIFDGSSPKTWAIEASNAVAWVSHQIDYPDNNRVLPLDSVDVFYGDRIERTDGDLGRLLTQRRLTVEAIRRMTFEASNRVRERLEAIRNHSEYDLHFKDKDGKRWYWTTQ